MKFIVFASDFDFLEDNDRFLRLFFIPPGGGFL